MTYPNGSDFEIENSGKKIDIAAVIAHAEESASGTERDRSNSSSTCSRTSATKVARPDRQETSSQDAVLIVMAEEDDPMFGMSFEIPTGQKATIGRDGEADICLLQVSSISRCHAEITNRRGRLRLRDCGSTNGSWVNGKPAARARLKSGDSIQLGSLELKVFHRGDLEGDFFLRMHERVARDDLTGACSRQKFEKELENEVARSARHGRPLSLILVDIDNFKKINDRFGHPTGDRVLIRLVELLHNDLRAGQTLARIGGEEFAVICPETGGAGAETLAERLRRRVSAGSFEARDPADSFSTSCSFGVAQCAPGMTARTLFSAADAALYEAKSDGRNRVVRRVHEETVDEI